MQYSALFPLEMVKLISQPKVIFTNMGLTVIKFRGDLNALAGSISSFPIATIHHKQIIFLIF